MRGLRNTISGSIRESSTVIQLGYVTEEAVMKRLPFLELGLLLTGVWAGGAFAQNQTTSAQPAGRDSTVKQDVKDAGKDTEDAAKKTGKTVEKTSKKVVHTSAGAVGKAADKTAEGVDKAANATAKGVNKGTEKVEDKTKNTDKNKTTENKPTN
jgi:hypothetical protein